MSQFFYCSRIHDTIHKFLSKMFKNLVDSFGCWCIIASLTLITGWHQCWDVPVTLVISSSDFQIFNDFENLYKTSKLHLKTTWLMKIISLLFLESCIWNCAISRRKHRKRSYTVYKLYRSYLKYYYKHCPRCRFMYVCQ